MNVTFLPEQKTIDVEEGISILDAAAKAGINIKSVCGGAGTCGKCKVELANGETVLACNTFISEDIKVHVPKSSRLVEHQVLLKDKVNIDLDNVLKDRNFFFNPLCYKVDLELSPPTLEDATSDLDRLREGLMKKCSLCNDKKLIIDNKVIADLAEILRENDWKITAYILDIGECAELVYLVGGSKNNRGYGLAIDIGTTTVVVYLIELENGEIVDQAGNYNKQAQFGDDVISRIVYATEEKNGLDTLQKAVTVTINQLINELLKRNEISKENIVFGIAAGNTTMTHLLLGITPKYIRLEPYIPTLSFVPPVKGRELQIDINPGGYIFNFPSIASYVGGDIVSGVLYTNMAQEESLTLFVDIGTNGEMVLGNKDWLVTCACSAGPAFEGGGITFGMRAMTGAIEKVFIDPESLELEIKVIGDTNPIGICGSGLIDCIAQLRKNSIIDRTGKIIMDTHPMVRKTESEIEFILAFAEDNDGQDIVLTENDIKNLIRSKGAVYAGIRSMLNMVDLTEEAIERVIIAGGFGNYLNIEDAVEIGLLPDLPRDKFLFMGNTSVKGAHLAMSSQEAWIEGLEIAKKMTYLELSVGNTFIDEYVSALFLPHTDLSQFPSGKE